MVSDAAAGAIAGLAVAMPIGAIGTYLIGLAARHRLGVAVAAALGVATVDGAYAVVAGAGGSGLSGIVQRVAGAFTVLAVVVLVVLAARTAQLAVRRYRAAAVGLPAEPPLTPGRAYLMLVGLTAVNPATVLTFAAVVLGRSAAGAASGPLSVLWFAVGAFAASACWQLALVGGGALLGRVLRDRKAQLAIALCSAALMLGLAVAVLAA